MAEHPVFDLVPLACPWWEVTYRNPQPQRVRHFLHDHFPQPEAVAITTASVRRDQQFLRTRVSWPPHLLPPAADRFRCEPTGVVVDAHTHPAPITTQVIHTVRDALAQTLVREVLGT